MTNAIRAFSVAENGAHLNVSYSFIIDKKLLRISKATSYFRCKLRFTILTAIQARLKPFISLCYLTIKL